MSCPLCIGVPAELQLLPQTTKAIRVCCSLLTRIIAEINISAPINLHISDGGKAKSDMSSAHICVKLTARYSLALRCKLICRTSFRKIVGSEKRKCANLVGEPSQSLLIKCSGVTHDYMVRYPYLSDYNE